VDRKAAEVKTNRSYDGSGRRAQAERTRMHVLATARRLFLGGDYASTTVAVVAAEAGVSVETIYKSFGGKPGLVRAIREQALRGVGAEPAERRSDELQTTQSDPRAIIREWAALTMEVSPQVAPVLLLVRDAAVGDPEMAQLRAELDDARLERMRHNAATLAEGGHLRAGLSLEHAAQVLWTYSSPELYELLVTTRGWNLQQYADFIAQAMIGALLP
jgi:AcrR family transcriptional regulator